MSLSGLTTDMSGYSIPDSGIGASGPPVTWSREEAQRDFDYFLEHIDQRIAELNWLTRNNDGPTLDYSDNSLLELNGWFVDRCEPEPDQENWPGGLTPEWYAVVGDIKAYMGQMLIRRKPHLYWTLATGSKRSLEYQKAVIAGFRNVPNKKYVVEYGSIVAILGMRVVKDELRDDSRSILLNVLLDDVEGA